MLPELQTLFLAMTPIGELRAAIPIGLTVHGLPLANTYFIAVIGNMVPVVFLLLFLGPATKFLRNNFKFFDKFFAWLFQSTRKKAHHKIQKYGPTALIALVAIPLPVTGAWTGSLTAFLFNIPFKKAFPLIGLGVALAGVIVSFATNTGIVVKNYFGWPCLAGIVTIIFITLLGYKIKNKL